MIGIMGFGGDHVISLHHLLPAVYKLSGRLSLITTTTVGLHYYLKELCFGAKNGIKVMANNVPKLA